MSAKTTHHSTFTIERRYAATPAQVFAAWADPKKKGRWFVGPAEWAKGRYELDFRVGGHERTSGGPKGGPVHRYEARWHDIVPNRRIVSTYEMYMDDARMSVSLATVELAADGPGTRLIYTEQGVYLDGPDGTASRESGTRDLFENLAAELARG
jgi:uncharacterized protein YndB with AHSA1/START domain